MHNAITAPKDFDDYCDMIAENRMAIDVAERNRVETILKNFRYVDLDNKTRQRVKRYYDRVSLTTSKIAKKRGFRFIGFDLKIVNNKTALIGLELNNLGTYFYIPECSEGAIWSITDKKYITLNDLREGIEFYPNTHMCFCYPNIFHIHEKCKITNQILKIYYDCKDKDQLQKMIKYIIFQQAKMIYRKKHEKQKFKNN